jgi:hypothetical protein
MKGKNLMWIPVTSEEFFKVIGPLDVHPEIIGKYPYTSIFKSRQGIEVGRIVDDCDGKSTYFLKS